jgi:hypothetical protein
MEILYHSVADEPNQRQVPHALPRSSHLRKRRHKLRWECRDDAPRAIISACRRTSAINNEQQRA